LTLTCNYLGVFGSLMSLLSLKTPRLLWVALKPTLFFWCCVGFDISLLGSRHLCLVQGLCVGCWIWGVGLDVSMCLRYLCWVQRFYVGFKGFMLGSRCLCRVQGIYVGFKVSRLGSRFLSWVQGICVGFEASMLGSRCLCWVRSVCVGFKASRFVHTRRLLVCVVITIRGMALARQWPVKFYGVVSSEIIHPLHT